MAQPSADEPVPACVRDMARRLRIPPGSKVAGIAATADGQALHDGVIVNGSDGALTNNAATLKSNAAGVPWRSLDVALTHVEGHVTALMREHRTPQRVALVLTEPPCPQRWGCHRMLPGLLTRGSELDVYLAEKDGRVRHYHTYHGIGTGVQ